jgi:prepilin-type N-terminal cleavage/methylation domain-containing protein
MRSKSHPSAFGFTLIELLVVIIILVLLAGLGVALMSVFFRDQGARQAGLVVTQTIAWAKQEAARTHQPHHLVFAPKNEEGWMTIHKDVDKNGRYDADPMVSGGRIDLPRGIVFDHAPEWLSVSPCGQIVFSPGHPKVPASSFDRIMNGPTPVPLGDIILRVRNQPLVMCLSLDQPTGKVRRSFFLNESP